MKQNIQEFSAINHKFNYSTIELKQMQVFLDFKVLLTCKTHESKYEQKPQQTLCIIKTQHNRTQQSYNVLQNPEN